MERLTDIPTTGAEKQAIQAPPTPPPPRKWDWANGGTGEKCSNGGYGCFDRRAAKNRTRSIDEQTWASRTMVVGTDGGAEFRLLDIEPIAYNADPRVADYKDVDEVMRLFLGES